MCTILLAWGCLDDAAFVLAANRDELVARPSAPPQRLVDDPPVYGGRDLLAGGTWLAVSADGVVAAVTNRRSDQQDEIARDPALRSRGELPVWVLRRRNDLRAALAGIDAAHYNPFNVMAVSKDAALVGHAGGTSTLQVVELRPGSHVLCVHDVDDAAHVKERSIGARLRDQLRGVSTSNDCVSIMAALLADHSSPSDDPRDAACIHGEDYGTVSASLVWMDSEGRVAYRHAPGRPCTTPFADVALG